MEPHAHICYNIRSRQVVAVGGCGTRAHQLLSTVLLEESDECPSGRMYALFTHVRVCASADMPMPMLVPLRVCSCALSGADAFPIRATA